MSPTRPHRGGAEEDEDLSRPPEPPPGRGRRAKGAKGAKGARRRLVLICHSSWPSSSVSSRPPQTFLFRSSGPRPTPQLPVLRLPPAEDALTRSSAGATLEFRPTLSILFACECLAPWDFPWGTLEKARARPC